MVQMHGLQTIAFCVSGKMNLCCTHNILNLQLSRIAILTLDTYSAVSLPTSIALLCKSSAFPSSPGLCKR